MELREIWVNQYVSGLGTQACETWAEANAVGHTCGNADCHGKPILFREVPEGLWPENRPE